MLIEFLNTHLTIYGFPKKDFKKSFFYDRI